MHHEAEHRAQRSASSPFAEVVSIGEGVQKGKNWQDNLSLWMRWTEKGGGIRITGRNDDDLMSGLAIERTVTAQWVSFGLFTLAVGFHYQNGVQMTIPT